MIRQIRKYRIFGIALFDLVLSFIGTILLFLLLKKWHFYHLQTFPFVFAAIVLAIPIGIVFHLVFGINTTLNYYLGLSDMPKKDIILFSESNR
jgi:hypothetical protein